MKITLLPQRSARPETVPLVVLFFPFLTLLFYLMPLSWVPPAFAQPSVTLLLTEVYYDTPGRDQHEEWIELTNFGTTTVDLSVYKVGDEEQLGRNEGMLRFPEGATLAPGEVIVVAQSAAGFMALFNIQPEYEIQDTVSAVADMKPFALWASGEFALNNDGDEVLLVGPENVIVDSLNYGDSEVFFTPSVNDVHTGQSIARQPGHCDTNTAGDWQPQVAPTPGIVVLEGECREATSPAIALDLLAVGAIQGPGDSSPYLNEVVRFRGVVTGILEDRNARGIVFYTLFVQDSAEDSDGNPQTSDGIAVFLGRGRPQFAVGDEVLVRGQVTEFYGLTEIDDNNLEIQQLSTGHALPPAAPLERSNSSLEALEGMRVSVAQARVVGPTFGGCGFAVVSHEEAMTRIVRQHLADDVSAIVPILHRSDVDCTGFPQLKVGDEVHGLAGPLIYHFDQFKIVQQNPESLVLRTAPLPALPSAPVLSDTVYSVATFNLLDHFDTKDDTGDEAEPKRTAEALRIKQTKLVDVIVNVLSCPTLLAVQEVENEALLGELAELLAPSCGFTYQIAHRESADARGIDVALMSDPRFVVVQSVVLRQACGEAPLFEPQQSDACPQTEPPLFSRPPLVVAMTLDDEPYTILVNHFKSKREGESETAPRRLAQAGFVRAIVDETFGLNERANVIVMGDFNDYALSEPLSVLTQAEIPLYDAMMRVPEEMRYSYNFGGVSQLLDTILLSPALVERLQHATIIHVNSDFPAAWASDPQTAWRASDHDIPLVTLMRKSMEAMPERTPVPTATPVVVATMEPTPEVSSSRLPAMVPILLLAGVVTALAITWRWRH